MKVNKNVIRVLDGFLEILYPRRCPICHKLLGKGHRLICEPCEKKLPRVREPRCKKCGKSIRLAEKEYCRDCEKHRHFYVFGGAPLAYNEAMKQSIYRFKYDNCRTYQDFYVQEMAKTFRTLFFRTRIDGIVPIPLHRKKQRKRGFNQAALLAKGLGRELGLPVYEGLLLRTRNTRPQKELTRTERQENLKTAFKIQEKGVELKAVLLIDDIYTTGATIDAAARVLLEAGVQKIYFLSLCIGSGE